MGLSAAGGVKVSTKRDDAWVAPSFWVSRDGERRAIRRASRCGRPRRDWGRTLVDAVGNVVRLFLRAFLCTSSTRTGLCVFEFPPMSSFVACKRVAATPDATEF